MAGNDSQESSSGNSRDPAHSSGSRINRRSVLQAGGTVGIAGFAGCVGSITGGGSNSVKIGSPLPLSGPFAAYGKNFQKSLKLAVERANKEGDAGDREIEIEFADTEGDPGKGRKAAQELLNNGADFLSGNYSSGVALAIGELAQRRGVIYQCVGGSNAITGKKCQPYQFNTGNSAVQQSVTMPYMLNEKGGESVYILYSDYAWAQSYTNWNKNHTIPDAGGKVVGTQAVPLGTNDWSGPITKAKNSGADHIHLAVTGTDLVRAVNTAFEYDVQKQSYISAAAATMSDVKAIGIDIMTSPKFYPGGTVWYWEHDAPDAKEFSKAFKNKHGEAPLNFAACHYTGTRTVLEAINEVGGTDPDQLRDALEGRKLAQQLWNVGEKYRACDHRATVSTMIVQAKKNLTQKDIDNQTVYRILDYPKQPESVMRTCEQTGCKMD